MPHETKKGVETMITVNQFRNMKGGEMIVGVDGYRLITQPYDSWRDTVSTVEVVNETNTWEPVGVENPYTTYADIKHYELL